MHGYPEKDLDLATWADLYTKPLQAHYFTHVRTNIAEAFVKSSPQECVGPGPTDPNDITGYLEEESKVAPVEGDPALEADH